MGESVKVTEAFLPHQWDASNIHRHAGMTLIGAGTDGKGRRDSKVRIVWRALGALADPESPSADRIADARAAQVHPEWS
jgi:hypothetical protein